MIEVMAEEQEPTEIDQTAVTKPADQAEQVSARREARRRFLLGGAATAPVILTLTSRPAFASQCSVSGRQSGNLSKPADHQCVGLTPGYWKTHPDQWNGSGYDPGKCTETKHGMTKNGTCTTYSGGTRCADIFSILVDPPDLTLMQALWLDAQGNPPTLLAHMVAGLLNAWRYGVGESSYPGYAYGYTVPDFIAYVNSRYSMDPLGLLNELDTLNSTGVPPGQPGG